MVAPFQGAQSGDLDAALECAEERLAVLRGIHDLSMEDGVASWGTLWRVKNGYGNPKWLIYG